MERRVPSLYSCAFEHAGASSSESLTCWGRWALSRAAISIATPRPDLVPRPHLIPRLGQSLRPVQGLTLVHSSVDERAMSWQ